MGEDKLLDVGEAAQFLGVTEQDVKNLVKNGALDAYQIGGMFLRFKLTQLQNFKNTSHSHQGKFNQRKQPLYAENLKDFFYFNDFYIIAVLLVAFMVFVILKNIS